LRERNWNLTSKVRTDNGGGCNDGDGRDGGGSGDVVDV